MERPNHLLKSRTTIGRLVEFQMIEQLFVYGWGASVLIRSPAISFLRVAVIHNNPKISYSGFSLRQLTRLLEHLNTTDYKPQFYP